MIVSEIRMIIMLAIRKDMNNVDEILATNDGVLEVIRLEIQFS